MRLRHKEAGLVIVAAIYLWAYLTATDPFWAGRATFLSMFVLLVVALVEVSSHGMEKS